MIGDGANRTSVPLAQKKLVTFPKFSTADSAASFQWQITVVALQTFGNT